MKWTSWTAAGCLTLSLAACNEGDFCEVYRPVGAIPEDVARVMIEGAEMQSRAIVTNERTYSQCVPKAVFLR